VGLFASLDIMATLMADLKNPRLLIIGIYSDEEVDDTHPLSKTIRDLEQVRGDNFGISKISVGSVEVVQVNDIISYTLATNNVVDLMKEWLKNLPPGIIHVIPSIARLGCNFCFPIFHLVVEHFSEKLFGTEENTNDVYSPPECLTLRK
jgi:hypothetical protein